MWSFSIFCYVFKTRAFHFGSLDPKFPSLMCELRVVQFSFVWLHEVSSCACEAPSQVKHSGRHLCGFGEIHFGTPLLVLWSTCLICLSFPILWVLCSTHDSAVLYLHSPSLGFPGGSTGRESTCNAEDPSLIPGSKRFPEEEIGYPLQFSWVSLVAQRVKNLPVMRETWVRSLGWEDPLEKGIAVCVCVCVYIYIYIYIYIFFFFFFLIAEQH